MAVRNVKIPVGAMPASSRAAFCIYRRADDIRPYNVIICDGYAL